MTREKAHKTPRTAFGRQLRGELDQQKVSVRELARRMHPHDPEGMRRNIARWLSPEATAVTPSSANVTAIAEALGVPRESLDPDDDEESDPVADLMRGLRALVREVTREREVEA